MQKFILNLSGGDIKLKELYSYSPEDLYKKSVRPIQEMGYRLYDYGPTEYICKPDIYRRKCKDVRYPELMLMSDQYKKYGDVEIAKLIDNRKKVRESLKIDKSDKITIYSSEGEMSPHLLPLLSLERKKRDIFLFRHHIKGKEDVKLVSENLGQYVITYPVNSDNNTLPKLDGNNYFKASHYNDYLKESRYIFGLVGEMCDYTFLNLIHGLDPNKYIKVDFFTDIFTFKNTSSENVDLFLKTIRKSNKTKSGFSPNPLLLTNLNMKDYLKIGDSFLYMKDYLEIGKSFVDIIICPQLKYEGLDHLTTLQELFNITYNILKMVKLRASSVNKSVFIDLGIPEKVIFRDYFEIFKPKKGTNDPPPHRDAYLNISAVLYLVILMIFDNKDVIKMTFEPGYRDYYDYTVKFIDEILSDMIHFNSEGDSIKSSEKRFLHFREKKSSDKFVINDIFECLIANYGVIIRYIDIKATKEK